MLLARRWPPCVAAVLALLLLAAPAHGQSAEASRVRILLIADTDTTSAGVNGFAKDHAAVKKALQDAFHAAKLDDRYTLDVLQGPDATAARILAYYRELKTGPDEVLVCYYSGHGATDPVDGHFLDLEGGPLKRSELRAAMQARKARLVVLLTDCCADFGTDCIRVPRGREKEKALDVEPLTARPRPNPVLSQGDTIRHLLFGPTGTVDITASAIGKQAFSNRNEGGYFTLAFVALLAAPAETFVRPGDWGPSWSAFFAVLRERTQAAAARDDNRQTPAAFALPGVSPRK
jgi:hypothetical protein